MYQIDIFASFHIRGHSVLNSKISFGKCLLFGHQHQHEYLNILEKNLTLKFLRVILKNVAYIFSVSGDYYNKIKLQIENI